MSGKRKTQQMSATYCRAYLVTLGLLLAGGAVRSVCWPMAVCPVRRWGWRC
ncbi:hypothetical protein LMG31886_14730 [Xanthomonas hydrangeae]|nr:hypothetical protein LMG31885_00760 [Xanthomonas hydrangeae]CAD7719477.1 hypothetical protein LMG31885_00760 [Xanthomonas hydrangeae]CAD7730832.1 hypothetical protein LMG31886_14730 [Xanthomonas hydrangeae]CAD7730836.1 hypothetical protein LMG31886_14730 [Xanthomonas hydrangeae]